MLQKSGDITELYEIITEIVKGISRDLENRRVIE
jgi:hypothetical protein